MCLAHGIVSFEADGGVAVDHAFEGEATDKAEVERGVVLRLGPAEMDPIGRGETARKADVVFGLR